MVKYLYHYFIILGNVEKDIYELDQLSMTNVVCILESDGKIYQIETLNITL